MPFSMQQIQKLSQRLIMTPQMQQSIKLLQMNTLDLESLTQQELLENPFLDIEADDASSELISLEGGEGVEGAETSVLTEKSAEIDAEALGGGDGEVKREELADQGAAALDEGPPAAEKPEIGTDAPGKEAALAAEGSVSEGLDSQAVEEQPEQFQEVDVDWGEAFDGDSDADASRTPEEADWAEIFDNAGPRRYSPPPDDSDQRSFEETIARKTSLYETLMWQLRVSALTGKDAEVAGFLIGCIDERGYLQTHSTLEDCAKRFKVDVEEVERILATIEENTSPRANIEELRLYIEKNLEKVDQKIGLELMGYLATEHARPGTPILYRKPTLEACGELFGVDRECVESALSIIQEFDPTGVGARDLPECLLLQLDAMGEKTILAGEILTGFWPQMMKKQFRAIARALKCDEEDVRDLFQRIQRLQPSPGLIYSKEQPVYITPDVYVRDFDGKFTVYLNEGEVAHLRLNNTYKNILLRENDAKQDPKEREYALEKYRAAVMFIKNVEKRRNTILRVTEAIMDYQREFLEKGVEALRPLSLAEIAERVSMHESTISRVTSSKYVDTPQGLFELKFFFSSAIESRYGEAASSRSIKNKIKDLIASEDPKRPLSDDKIAKHLKSLGFSIARRTVAKYREQMKILPTNLRRKND